MPSSPTRRTDDTPRLVFADWLDENGDADRAEFIRVQVELARADPAGERYPELHLRQLQLLSEHERDWLGPWADRLVRWRFRRGLLDEVTVEPEPFVAHGADLLTGHTVRTVAFVDAEGESLPPAAIGRVVGEPHFGLIRELELSGCRLGEAMFGMFGGAVCTSIWLMALARAGHVTRLESVALPGGTRSGREAIEPTALAWFCAAPHLATLRRLDLSNNYQSEGPDETPELCGILAGATFAAGLRWLSLSHVTLTDDALARLTASVGLRNLEAVDLTYCDALGGAALRAFLASRPPGRLTEFGLPYGLDLRELGAWPGLAAVRRLSLSGMARRYGEQAIHYPDGRHVRWTPGRDVGADEWLALFRSPHLRPERLALSAQSIPDDALAVLVEQNWVDGLRALDVWTNPWERRTGVGVFDPLLDRVAPRLHELGLPETAALSRRRLAAWPALPRLTRFSVKEGKDFAVWLLSQAPLTPRAERIDLDQSEGDLRLARVLARSVWARGVVRLDYGYNGLKPGVVASLAAASFARHLEALHLGSERGRQTLAAVRMLADDRHFPRLRDVVVGSETVEGGIDVLRRRFGPRLRVWADC